MADERYMRLALDLALKGEGFVEPNPLVGAVIVKNNKIIGKGYHSYFGGPHAEINAINSVKNPEQLKGSTLYLTLESCVHFGKTPPCAPAIVQSGIKEVVIAARDPNQLVSGKGIGFLKQNGIKIIEGVLRKEAENINKPFFKLHLKGLPYVVAKWAMSLDGKLATKTGDSKWITSEKSRNYAKSIRAQCQGVMVGIGTVLADNPVLLPKVKSYKLKVKSKNPVRIILDSNARLPLQSNLVRTLDKGDVYVMVSRTAPKNKIAQLEVNGCQVFTVPTENGLLNLRAALKILAKNGINKIMMEGGGEVLGSAFDHKVVDEVYAFIAPKIIGGSDSKMPVSGKGILKIKDALNLKDVTVKYLNPDILVHGYI
ncbi:MAG: bifunctional diaminohydroxyphosphoribosylaminopyrimidine deaminase/5-amino-6-(5-phosphoribosylamino)uracil reductase RibD [Planctomycetota bacterium]